VRDFVKRAGRHGHRAITAAVTSCGNTTFEAWSARGPHPTPDTVFEIGSITKAITGALLADMHLVAAFSPERHRAVVVLSNTARSVDRLGWRLLYEA
jgi:Beta-lactamase